MHVCMYMYMYVCMYMYMYMYTGTFLGKMYYYFEDVVPKMPGRQQTTYFHAYMHAYMRVYVYVCSNLCGPYVLIPRKYSLHDAETVIHLSQHACIHMHAYTHMHAYLWTMFTTTNVLT